MHRSDRPHPVPIQSPSSWHTWSNGRGRTSEPKLWSEVGEIRVLHVWRDGPHELCPLTGAPANPRRKGSMSETLSSLRPSGQGAVQLDGDGSPPPVRNGSAGRLHCSFCQAEIGESRELTTPGSGKHGHRTSASSFCSTYCRDCVLALAALHPSPLASSEFVSTRTRLTDRLLDLWRRGQGPDPALVLQAARAAGCGLALGDAD